MNSISMADGEFEFLHATLGDKELARVVAGADDEGAVALLLKAERRLLSVLLWRNRTGADLKTALTAVCEVERRLRNPVA